MKGDRMIDKGKNMKLTKREFRAVVWAVGQFCNADENDGRPVKTKHFQTALDKLYREMDKRSFLKNIMV